MRFPTAPCWLSESLEESVVWEDPIVGRGCLIQDSELAVSLLYELGEGASEEALKAGSGALGQLALGERLLPSLLTSGSYLFWRI